MFPAADRYSPEGAVITTPLGSGVPKFGVPFAFQVIGWTRVSRVEPQPWAEVVLAW
jgi:hypothetical protein